MKKKCDCGYELDSDTHYSCPICGQYTGFDDAKDYDAFIKSLTIAGSIFISFIIVIILLLIYAL